MHPQWRVLKKLKVELPGGMAILVPVIYCKELKQASQSNTLCFHDSDIEIIHNSQDLKSTDG